MEEVVTAFTIEQLMAMPKGSWREFHSPLKDRTGRMKIALTDAFCIVDDTVVTDTDTAPWTHYNDTSRVEMNFMLEGESRQSHGGLLERHPYRKGYHNILFNPFSMETNQLMGTGTHRMFYVYVSPEKMMELFSGYLEEMAPFAEKLAKGEPFVLHSPAKGLSHTLQYFFDSFWARTLPLPVGRLYFESRVMELLANQCHLLLEAPLQHPAIGKADLEKIHHSRDVILQNLCNPLSLEELSKRVCLNEFKLKRYFKQVFGLSVFALVQEERLQRAKRLIFEGEKNISAIAYELGYAHPQHFQRAFKQRFGVTPGSLLK
ncbi:MAG TPA: AraC family transcriptional regulator [Dinghuibacter sp.]|uniref:helix-turn-helix transcriptional regulator n=1 Tax=Dinghuibacter sp. TaxID=2024697 RepID=UPI002C265853|nr:AraC family transcriptional regulator [Dinghuibacter sp.]HTJ11256.1 AraC family transcriptional regulator [Dinghuibacter sp.]